MKQSKIFEQYHFIGIGGIGMSALARILAKKGIKVSGSDSTASPILETLKNAGIEIHVGHLASHVPETGAVVYNSMVTKENPEMKAALEKRLPILHRSD